MERNPRLPLVILASVMLSACGKSYSCTVDAAQTCVEFGTGYIEVTAEAACTQLNGVYSTSDTCSTENVHGKCVATQATLTTTQYYYSAVAATAGETQCTTQEGNWSLQ